MKHMINTYVYHDTRVKGMKKIGFKIFNMVLKPGNVFDLSLNPHSILNRNHCVGRADDHQNSLIGF